MERFTAGPTSINSKTRNIFAEIYPNADIEDSYYDLHFETEDRLSSFLGCSGPSFLILAEALFGLEAAVHSFCKNQRVLILDNGIFGRGFADFVTMAQGEAILLSTDPHKGISEEELKRFLEKDSDFTAATLIHCETPSGITNPVDKLCPILKSYGILSIVDAVSSIGSDEIDMDRFGIDVLIGGSQKVFSLPSGLTTITLSQRAVSYLKNRPFESGWYYGDIKNYLEERDDRWFLYTMNPAMTKALYHKLEEFSQRDPVFRHKAFGDKVRKTVLANGLTLWAKDSFANSVTTLWMEDISVGEFLRQMEEKGYLLSGGLGHMKENTFRLGHMGDNLDLNWQDLFRAMDEVFKNMGKETELEKTWIELP